MNDIQHNLGKELFHVNCLWVKGALRPVEHVCLLSMLRQGHQVRLFTYEKITNVPEGIEVLNAEEILPRQKLLVHKTSGSFALGSDIFRFTILQKGLGLWLDLDVLMLQPIYKQQGLILGYQDVDSINGAILYLPQRSHILKDLIKFMGEEYPIPPFFKTRRRRLLRLKAFLGRGVPPENLRWGVFGPNAITYFASLHQMRHLAQTIDVFYPVPCPKAHIVFMKEEDITPFLTPQSRTIHLWNEVLRRPSSFRPHNPPGTLRIEKGSFIETFARKELGFQLPEEG